MRTWAVLRQAESAADENGNPAEGSLSAADRTKTPMATILPQARVAALKDILALPKAARTRLGPEGAPILSTLYARPLARAIAARAPGFVRARAKEIQDSLQIPAADTKKVIAALEETAAAALGSGRADAAIAAAQALIGLARQSGFKDLKGPKAPDIKAKGDAAAGIVERARQMIAQKDLKVWTVEELKKLEDPEIEAFTRAHAGWASPGVCVSPGGLYRIETVCGHATLLGVAESIESHHRRLARWFGADPFQNRQGIVRIVPEASGLEGEGAPFWWAGGFQRGDVTVLRFSVGSIESLGHGLTHELTHRFDGVLSPFQSSWLTEGKAVWTGAAFGSSADEIFVPNHCSIGTVEDAFMKGYGAKEKLEKLIKGTIDDYRDNYVAGYALFVYLTTWEADGKKLYAERFREYVKNGLSGRGKPLEWFTANFADGKDGRPAKFDDFVKSWAEFLQGFYWLSRAPWLDRYTGNVPKGPPFEWVYDTPTWVFSRARAEPYFGQDEALIAANVLAAEGKIAAAIEAYSWAIEVDEWGSRIVEPLARIFEAQKKPASARLLAAIDRRKRPFANRPVPEANPFAADLKNVYALVRTLEKAAEDERAANRPAIAAAFADEARTLRFLLGDAPGDAVIPPRTFGSPARRLGLSGWKEDELAGYDERRAPGLWAETEDADLFVGRTQPKSGSGEFDRTASRRDAFTRTEEWFADGRYRISMRIAFTTAYASGDVVFGDTRRDRNLRFRFSAGDYMYSIGRSKTEPKFDAVDWGLSGLRDRDGGLFPSAPGGRFKFNEKKASFDLELTIDGADVEAKIDGRWVAAYHTPDGLPIEGHVGIATNFGAVRCVRPTIERLDGRPLAAEDQALDLTLEKSAPLNRMMNRTVKGVPAHASGTLFVFDPLPPLTDGKQMTAVADMVREAADAAAAVRKARDSDRLPQRLVLAVPYDARADMLKETAARLAELGEKDIEVVLHRRQKPLDDDGQSSLFAAFPTVAFIDPTGALRAHDAPLGSKLPEAIRHWCRVYRDADRFRP